MNYLVNEPTESGTITEPANLQEMKDWARVTFDSEDTIITDLIKVARQMLENYTGRKFASRTVTIEVVIGGPLSYKLPCEPVTLITSVKRKEEFVSDETLTSGTDFDFSNGVIYFRGEGRYEVSYTAGYTTIPADLKTDMKRLVQWLFTNRASNFEGQQDIADFPEWRTLAANAYVTTVI